MSDKLKSAFHEELLETEVAALREQNRVLREALRQALDDIPGWVMLAKAALTATSQPVPPYKEWCRHPEKCAGLASCPQDPTCAD